MKRPMISLITGSCMLGVSGGMAMAETVTFDQDKAGTLPAGWKSGVTGRGAPKWTIDKDDTAPTPPNVLKQSGSGTFPWCVKTNTSIENGSVDVLVDHEVGGDLLEGNGPQVALVADGNAYPVQYRYSLIFRDAAGLARGTYPLSLRTELGTYPGLTILVHRVDEFTYSFDDVG